MNKIKMLNFLVILILFLNVTSTTIKSQIRLNLSTNEDELSLTHFSQSLREKQLNHISNMNNFLTLLAQVDLDNTNEGKQNLKNELTNYLRDVGNNIDDINNGFKKNYDFCVNKLKKLSMQCTESTEELRDNIKFNKLYALSLGKINDKYDGIINNFYNSNIYSTASNVCGGNKDITEKNDIVNLYMRLAKHLESHFSIFKSAEMEKALVEVDEKEDSSLDRFLTVVIKKYKTIHTEEGKPDYLIQRKNLAQILFNKVSSYMDNSIERKSKLLKQSEQLFMKMKKNDDNVKEHIDVLQKQRRNNSELEYSLNKENQNTINKIRECEKLDNLNSRCKETSNLYNAILNSYEEQSESLEGLIKLISKQRK